MKDLLTGFEEKKKARPFYLLISVLQIIALAINFYLYYRPFNADRYSIVFSSSKRILYAISYHVIPLVGVIYLLKRRQIGWILLAIFSMTHTVIKVRSILTIPDFEKELFRLPTYFLINSVFILFLLCMPVVRRQFHITPTALLYAFIFSVLLPIFLILYIN
jgi:hypothetical protein